VTRIDNVTIETNDDDTVIGTQPIIGQSLSNQTMSFTESLFLSIDIMLNLFRSKNFSKKLKEIAANDSVI